jgi:hypothetical protein
MALPPARQLFVLQAGGAEQHVKDTVARPVNRHLCEAKLPLGVLDRARSESGDGELYCWGAVASEHGQRLWDTLGPGDYVLFRQKGRYTFVARVISKHPDADFAREVWGTDKEGRPWELVYFLTRPERTNVVANALEAFVSPDYQQSTRVGDGYLKRILQSDGSLERFIARRLLGSETTTPAAPSPPPPAPEQTLESDIELSGWWWVNQGATFEQESAGGYLWAPTRTLAGAVAGHHVAMTQLEAGHFVIHYAKGSIRAVGIVGGPAELAPRPSELPEASWQTEGYRAEVEYHPVAPSVGLANIPDAIRKSEAPFDQYGGVKQGYLFPLSSRFRDWFLQTYGSQVPAILRSEPAPGEPLQAPVVDEPTVVPARDLLPYTMEDALADLFVPEERLREALELLRAKHNLVLQGPPGVGKTFVAQRLAYLLMGRRDPARIEPVQFHQSYSYEDFVQGYRPTEAGGFERRDGLFVRFCNRIRASPGPAAFLIDEINRGNLSKILGELMLLIESDKRGPEWAVSLAYARDGEQRFSVPENLFLIGTMNTADRSLAMVDYALRRRFVFVPLPPAFGTPQFNRYLTVHGLSPSLVERITSRFTTLNDAIRADTKHLGEGFEIGHSYFCHPPADPADHDRWYARIIRTEIRPLLAEYWYDDPDRVLDAVTALLAPD